MKTLLRFAGWALIGTLTTVTPSVAGSWEWGVKGGVNLATFRGDFDDVVGFDDRVGFAGGLFARLQANRMLGAQVEVLYTQKGAKTTSQETDEFGNPTGRQIDNFWKVDYLEIPVLARLVVAPGARMRPFLVAGPAFGIPLRGEFESESGFEQDLSDLKNVDLGVAGGLGIEWDVAEYRMALEGRYTRGISDIYDIEDNLESINSVFTIALAISR